MAGAICLEFNRIPLAISDRTNGNAADENEKVRVRTSKQMGQRQFDWRRFEDILIKRCEKAIVAAMNQFPDESFYAAAFHEFYAEEGGMIKLPCLALNTEEEIDDEEDDRWDSAD